MGHHPIFVRGALPAALAFLLTLAGGVLAPSSALAAAPPNGLTELSPTPPNVTRAVPPNIMVTFDDSGSMASNFMGDNRPFDNGSWSGPWRCAGVIDSRVTAATDVLSRAMNGVYYNPNVAYTPPMKADGTFFPEADATLQSVALDGIALNRPFAPVAAGATTWRNNPNSGAAANDSGLSILNGIKPATGPDRRWTCGFGTSPMDATKLDADGVAYPNGGPYYYRYMSSAPAITVDGFGNPDGAGVANLYNAANWEAVAVTNTAVTIGGQTVNQWQNFANWYAYYRTRNLMTKTALSRVFGTLGATTDTGGFGTSIRAAWQNINDGNYKLPGSAIITSLLDAAGCDASSTDPQGTQQQGAIFTSPDCYRTAFFNWIYQVGANGTTPNRASTIRAGQFFQRAFNMKGFNSDLTDPYWQEAKGGGRDGLELACRQNYHMLVTDGFWNEGDPGLPSAANNAGFSYQTAQAVIPGGKLPDKTPYSVTNPESRVFWDVAGSVYKSSLANIAFNYWATNLRPDLYDPLDGKVVSTFMPDSSTGIVSGATSTDMEKYFNPNNDPANWPHLVQYMVTLGVPGLLTHSTDADCVDANNDLCKLRRGLINSTTNVGWPRPINNNPTAIDDTWHAAINSRGAYFNAGNPQNLVDQLVKILTNITARNIPATTSALNTSVLVQGALGFTAGYSSADWTGVFQAITANADGSISGVQWDAGAILTDPAKTNPASRQILTSKEKANGRFDKGIAFRTFGVLDDLPGALPYVSAQTLLSAVPASGGGSDNGQARLDYLRGVRTLEGAAYRTRSSLLGAVISSQALYVSVPSSGYRNTWPTGSAEAAAMLADSATCASTSPTTCHSYESFQSDHLDRLPTVYVGANDGMLHAFNANMVLNGATPPVAVPDADAGKELFAYVPRTVFANLGNLTNKTDFNFEPTVDATPVSRDVFYGGAWHTLLVGGLRGGGRGVYALDITDPTQVTEASAGTKVLWEFNSDAPNVSGVGNPADLGYTYGQPNIARLNTGKWVVLVPGGYFPDCSKSDKPANCVTLAAALSGYSALFVLDAETGTLIRELKTLTSISGVVSGGLSSVVLGDYNNDQVDDVAFAGDLNGNLWRFDLTNANPASWQAGVTLAYQPTAQGEQPITVMPRLFPDPATNRFIVVFGTGKYLGAADNTSNSAATQSILGIRDNLTTVTHADLQQQTLFEGLSSNGINTLRGLTDNPLTATQGGWFIDLNLASSPGERVVVTPGALFDSNRALITTLIPGTQDPCTATIGGALMVLNAATGGAGGGLSGPGAPSTGAGWPIGTQIVGGLVTNPPTGGSVPVATVIGGGTLLVPGLQLKGGGSLGVDDAIWRRRSWRVLNNDQ